MTEYGVDLPEKPEPKVRKRKSPVVALLSLFLSGLGHFYIGEARRGLILLSLEMALTALFFGSPIALSFAGLFFLLIALLTYKTFVVIDSVLLNRKKVAFELKRYNHFIVYSGLILGAMALTSLIQMSFVRVEAFNVVSPSMVPTFLTGDHVMVDTLAYRTSGPRRGDIIAFQYPQDPERDFIKRVVATAGDVIAIRDKVLFLNGAEVKEPYAVFLGEDLDFYSRDNFGPYEIPEGKIFVLGDNRDNSSDSRYWGPVDIEDVAGEARFIYWSWDRGKRSVRWDRIGKQIR